MGSRGRVSAAALSLISSNGVETIRRPSPPSDLTEEQAAEWKAVVNRLPADWFPRETHAMLATYCRHVVSGRRVAEMIQVLEADLDSEVKNGADKVTVMLKASETFDRLLKMQEREGRAMSSLATRMRLSQQTTYDKSRKKPVDGKRPWQDAGK